MNKEKRKNYVRTKYAESSPEYQFGTRLSKEMKKKGLSTSKLAEMMDVSESAVKDWRQHYTIPKQAHLDALCRIFAPCSNDYFLGTIDAPSHNVKFIMEYTGLSAAAVQYLHGLNEQERTVLNSIFSSESEIKDILDTVIEFKAADKSQKELFQAQRENKYPAYCEAVRAYHTTGDIDDLNSLYIAKQELEDLSRTIQIQELGIETSKRKVRDMLAAFHNKLEKLHPTAKTDRITWLEENLFFSNDTDSWKYK